MGQEKTAAPAVHETRGLVLLALLVVVGCGGPAAPPAGVDADTRSFTGSYELRAVDGVALSTAVRIGFMGATMHIESGTLTFGPAREVVLKAIGPLGSSPDAISVGYGSVYVRVGADSLQTAAAAGLEGRVWGDSAEVRTASWTTLGAHVWRYVRAPAL